ncbi:MAG TPA: DUF2232 domain-containing protein [Gemmatimonadaceae bacterium]|jgi:hypothetical protein|nr:DUF2232 domain-containing protein [Gemmatimonadaceae bacterium]
MAEATTTAVKKQSWWPLLWGLAALLICPYLPLFEALIPIQQTLLLLVPVIAACSIIGWMMGGRLALAVIWIAFSIWMLLQPAGPRGTQYDLMARGWAILLAASFGLVSLWGTATSFFSRALAAVGIATAVGFLIALSFPSGIARFEHAAGEELTRRASLTIERVQESLNDPQSRAMLDKFPMMEEVDEQGLDVMRQLPSRAASLLPALLALESLAVLAFGWGVYRRLTPVEIGPPLGRLAEFRFNDQLIWGLAVGATLWLLPAFEEGKNAGYNLLLFFGTLYLIRGIGVLGWIAKGRYVFVVILGLVPQILIIVALALGLGDTWLDLRRRAKAS